MLRVCRPVVLLVAVLAVSSSCLCAAQSDDRREIYDSEKGTGLVAADDALKKMRLPDGFEATVFAAEPDVRQPIAVTTDARGRLWVVENYTYAESSLNFDTELRDRIVIFEDTDHDGRADERTVFWDEGVKATSVEIGLGGVWVTAAPNLLFIPDADGDDQPDGPAQVVLDGWDGGPIRHNIVNGLRWGPDGWLYGRHGIQATSLVGKPGSTSSQRTRVTCGIWRYHPKRDVFEIVAQGTTNPWGFDYDQHGEMFMINTVIGHLWHVVPGAYYRRMHGAHFHPWTFQLIEQTADHFHWDTEGEAWSDLKKNGLTDATDQAGGGHAHCGFMIYQGINWPAAYRNGAFTLNLHGRRVNHDRLLRRGNGYVGRHARDMFRTDDEWFRGVELIYGRDGGVYILDWSDTGECHENDGVHRSSGRIYKINWGTPERSTVSDVAALNDEQLVTLQFSENEWLVRTARRVLMDRAAAGSDLSQVIARLLEIIRSAEGPGGLSGIRLPAGSPAIRTLRSLWCLTTIGYRDEALLLELLSSRSEHVRAWAIRLLVDGPGEPSVACAERFVAQAENEASGLVRLYLASALNRLEPDVRLALAGNLLNHEQDIDDRMQPLMIWYGLEPAVISNPSAALRVAIGSRIPLARRFVARRLAGHAAEDPAPMHALVELLGELPAGPARRDLVAGLADGLAGWRKAPQPPAWATVSRRLAESEDPATAARVRELGVVFGDGRALADVRRLATDRTAAEQARREAIAVLAEARPEGLFAILKPLVRDKVVADDVVAALAACDQDEVPSLVLGVYDRLRPSGRAAVIDTLTTRPAWSVKLLEAVGKGQVERSTITAFHARQMGGFDDPVLSEKLKAAWGAVRESSMERRAQIESLAERLDPDVIEQADLVSGRVLFNKSCANCHTLFGSGGNIGPDLTGSNRRNLTYLLENIIDPSASVAASFRLSIIVLDNGRQLNGVVVSETPGTLTLQLEKERVTVPKTDIEERKVTAQSLMPEGLLKSLTAEQTRDLLGYLMSAGQVALPDGAGE